MVKTVEDVLKARSAHAATFCGIGEHAPVSGIKAGLGELKTSGADIVVSVGGGSPIDAAKAMIYFLEQAGGPRLKHVAIPTTFSAAEYTVCYDRGRLVYGRGLSDCVWGHRWVRDSLMRRGRRPESMGRSSPQPVSSSTRSSRWLLRNVFGCPLGSELWITLLVRTMAPTTRMQHVAHVYVCSENLYRPVVPIPLKYLCYGAIRDLFKYLPLSKADPRDLVARQRLQVAAWMSLWPLKTETFR